MFLTHFLLSVNHFIIYYKVSSEYGILSHETCALYGLLPVGGIFVSTTPTSKFDNSGE